MKGLVILWAAAWRGEVVHLALFVAVPVLLWAVKALLGIVFLPFLLPGFGDTHRTGQSTHLGEAACWIALAPCPAADVALFDIPLRDHAASEQNASAAAARASEPFAEVPGAFTVRHLWFFLWLAWFIACLIARERRHRQSR